MDIKATKKYKIQNETTHFEIVSIFQSHFDMFRDILL